MNKADRDPKVLVVNVYGHENLGEAIRHLRICRSLFSYSPGIRLAAAVSGDATRASFRQEFHDNVDIVEEALPSASSPICFKPLRIPALIKAYISADFVVSIGGHFGQLSSLFPLFLAHLMKKPTIIYGASTNGPIDNIFHRSLARRILNNTRLITLREEASRKHIQRLKITKPCVHVTAPEAFLWERASNHIIDGALRKEGLTGLSPLIGINISRWPGANRETYQKYVVAITRLVDCLTAEMDATIVLVPFCFAKGHDDRIENSRIREAAKLRNKVKALEDMQDIPLYKGLIGRLDLFIGTRFHANIFALSESVPTLALSYHHKMTSAMEAMEMSEWVLDCAELDSSLLVERVTRLWSLRDEIVVKLDKAAEVMKNRAMLDVALVNRLIARHSGQTESYECEQLLPRL
ncbi:MAG: polysaccharide pyruvyl transferase family protein [Chloroflexi bacterium]|nr:polysaccharide pyruvyl transferase family protein [Chloroflexota bacterium]